MSTDLTPPWSGREPEVRLLVREGHRLLALLTPEQRVELLDSISDGYCRHCGFLLSAPGLRCCCTADD